MASDSDKEPHNSRLQTQLALIDRAQVSTLHGFCARLLRQHFHIIGLDPSFKILDNDEAKLLRSEVARNLFDDRYEADPVETDSPSATDTEAFLKLIDDYGNGNDDDLRRQVVSTHELLGSLIEPERWIKAARARLKEGVTGPLKKSELGKELVKVIARKLNAMVANCKIAVATVFNIPGFRSFVEYLLGFQRELSSWQFAFADGDFDALAKLVVTFDKGRLPSVPKDTPGKELAVNAVESVRDEMAKDGALASLLRFSAAEWIEGLRSIQPAADVFLDLVIDFGIRYRAAKQRIRSLDFNDLERLTLKVLRDPVGGPTDVARLCHRQLHHVLVDEYQDINEIQDEILRLVSRECVCDDPATKALTPSPGIPGEGERVGRSAAISTSPIPNLFCVGDVKQSIYGFRLAEPARFLDRNEKFRTAKSDTMRVIDLQQNFRGRAPLLNAINALFGRLMTREAADIEYDKLHELHAGGGISSCCRYEIIHRRADRTSSASPAPIRR